MLLIESEFIKKIKTNQQKATNSECQPCYIKRGVELISPKVPAGRYEIIFYHG
ncbi:MAG: hypothetical protein ACXWWC_06410 [Chitinophagaceae bacterium]